jgi:beta-glucanase (GH16 family)
MPSFFLPKQMRKIIVIFGLLSISYHSSAQWQMIWNDEFDNPILDNSKWINDVGGNGWGNNEAQYYTAGSANLSMNNGLATITAKAQQFGSNQYTSAKIISKNLFDVKYGKIEGRMKCPMGKGLWPAFWMLGSNIDTVSWPQCGEIDIMEHINNEPKIHGTAHWNNVGHQYLGGTINTDPAVFHTYSIVWDANSIKWYMDDQLYYILNISNNTNGTEEFHKKFYLILNLAVGGNWPGYPDASTVFPAEFVIDYIRVYKPAVASTDELLASSIELVPNPADQTIQLISDFSNELFKNGQLWSMEGRFVQTIDFQTPLITIQHLEKGAYFISFEVNGKQVVKQFLKQ